MPIPQRATRFASAGLLALVACQWGCAMHRDAVARVDAPPSPVLSSVARGQIVADTEGQVGESVKDVTAVGFWEDDLDEMIEAPRNAANELPAEALHSVAATGGLTLADVQCMALANNPAIRQSSAVEQRIRGVRDQVGRSANPTAGYFGSQLADQGTDQHGLFIEQEFVRGDKLWLNERVLDHASQVQLWNVETQRQRVLTDVRMRFYEALAAQRQTLLTYEFLKTMDRGVGIAKERTQAGEGTQIEVLQAKVQRSGVDLSRQQAGAAFLGAWKDLVAIAGLPDLPPQILVDELNVGRAPIDATSTYDQLQSGSPELNSARARVGEARALIDRQKAQPISNVTVQVGAGVDNATGSGLINLQVAAPIPVHNDNSGNISAACADYCRATHDVRRIELAIKSRLARALQDYESALAAVQKLEDEILPDAQEMLTLSEQAYEAGELNFLQVLVVRRTFFDSNVQHIRALGDLAQSKTKIDGLLLTGGLDAPAAIDRDDSLRDQTFNGQ